MSKRLIEALGNELRQKVSEMPAFAEAAYSVFNLDDLKTQSELQSLPVVGVTFDGASTGAGNAATATGKTSPTATLVVYQFSVILGLQYYFSGQDDTKPAGHNLLDDLREEIMGYQGVNKRPWVWVGEKPEDDTSTDGLIFYSQVWRTSVPIIGKTNN